MGSVVTLGPIRDMEDDPTQLELYSFVEDGFTNALGIWDMAPWYVLYTNAEVRMQGKFLDKITRAFEYRGRAYEIVLRPARIDTADGERDEYAGEREQLVELAIRKIAAQRARLALARGNVVSAQIGLYELRLELKRSGHDYRYDQIRDALFILHGARVEIVRVDGDGDSKVRTMLSETIFPSMILREHSDGEPKNEVLIHFNALITDSIKKLDFCQIDYDVLISLRPVARWVYKYLHHELVYADDERREFTVNASVVYRNCGMGEYSRLRDALDRVQKGIDALVEVGDVIERVEARPIFEQTPGRPRKVDIAFSITVAASFLASARRARAMRVAKIESYRQVEGETPTRFLKGSTGKRSKVRSALRVVSQSALPLDLPAADRLGVATEDGSGA